MSKYWTRLKMEYIFWWARRLPACDELLPLMSRRMDEPLPWGLRIKLALHNHICEWCKRYEEQLLLVRQAVQKEEVHQELPEISKESLPDDARERLKRALGER